MNGALDTSGGELRFEQPIPRVRHVRLPGEEMLDLMRRTAQSVAFAFHLDAERTAAQPGFEYSGETAVLPDGVISRSTMRGSTILERDAARIAATGADQLFIIILEAGLIDVQPTRSGRRLREGDILIVDLKKAVTLTQSDYTGMMIVISRSLLPKEVRCLDLHCSEIRADHPLARVIAGTCHRLWEDSRRMTPAQGAVVFRGAMDMLGLALTDSSRARGEEVPLKVGAEAIIDDHLQDAALTPAWIAGRLGVARHALPHLHRLRRRRPLHRRTATAARLGSDLVARGAHHRTGRQPVRLRQQGPPQPRLRRASRRHARRHPFGHRRSARQAA